MLVMASLGLPPSFLYFQGLGFSLRKTLTTDRCLRMNARSKESSIFDHTNNHSDHQNGKAWTTSNNDLIDYRTDIHGEEQRLPPLIAAMKSAMEENPATFQFPGHNRGFAAPPSLTQLIGEWPFLHDVGELDDLFTPEGPILEAQREAAKVFGASETWFLVGGTTCGVLAAIMGTCSPGDVLILTRNSHISAISALALCGAIPKYIFPDYDSCWDAPTLVSPLEVEKAIKELASEGKKPAAVFITSPTYHGICSNVKEISKLCHLHDIPLIVDEAHGAHFGFHPQLPLSALQQGADLVIQSTHKVLLSLSQSSMLHKSQTPLINKQKISKCLQILQSTSPSFLLLASLDATTAQLKINPKIVFDNAIHLSIEAKKALQEIPGVSVLDLPNSDPLRVTVGVYNFGVSGYEARDILYKDQRLLPVLTSSRAITFLFTPGTCKEHVDRLVKGFKHLSVLSSNLHNMKMNGFQRLKLKPFMEIDMRFSPREAFFAKKKKVEVNDCVGKICGELICPYPPGIPVMIPGEVISEKGLSMLLQAKAHGAKIIGASDPLLTSIVVCDL
ncbi:uncharacterized protein LOC130797830 isoform X1 [Amaranthus tricolor]|uniref:uncharacterized protein LOC130797830 isoform X1 n=1 Tax=Amaranthus tricolor TaxID=29722 RepID=UPI00258B6346|nr:uncharacterized protein LOC130797830 isoform X1 [Amaranthus tricolor]